MTTPHLQCVDCRHFHREKAPVQFSCDAFPERIPDEIFFDGHDHTEPFEGDNGIQFEPIEDEESDEETA